MTARLSLIKSAPSGESSVRLFLTCVCCSLWTCVYRYIPLHGGSGCDRLEDLYMSDENLPQNNMVGQQHDEQIGQNGQQPGQGAEGGLGAHAQNGGALFGGYHAEPPKNFDFRQPTSWTKWLRHFNRFRSWSQLAGRPGAEQVNMFVYCMGEEADDILETFVLTEAQRNDFDAVCERFTNHFILRRNVIYERAKFNSRVQ